MDEYIGIVKLFAGPFAPVGWRFCDGSLIPISQYQAVFAILGTTYGGDGVTTFALPDLRSRVPVGAGQGPGLSNYPLGQKTGSETITATINNLPQHNHVITGSVKIPINDSNADADGPVGSFLGAPGQSIYSTTTNGFAANATSDLNTSIMGGSNPLPITQPILASNYIICMEGIFPSRN